MRLLKALIFAIWAVAFTVRSIGEVALPNPELVNSPWMSVTNFWSGAEPLEMPKQLMVDFSYKKSGVVSGLSCEYPIKPELFQSIRERIQKQLKIKPKAETPGQFIVWRDEVAKRAITITLDESKRYVLVIITSFDREV